jgi:hypothetical protein
LDRKQPLNWNESNLAAANKLLPEQSDVRLFWSPYGYSIWQRRLKEAMQGQVLGGRPKKDFPESPPIGIAGGTRDSEFWLEAAIPIETIQSAGTVLKK